ncbi:MAG: dihydroorotate dehydrogenase-like protein [Spirochaetia bacterium]
MEKPDLSVQYMGLTLRNPIIVSSSSLTDSLEGVRKCWEAGAGAVVLKSLFEEQIAHETEEAESSYNLPNHPEAGEYVQQMGMRLGPERYLSLIKEIKDSLPVPLIASVNSISTKYWLSYAKQISRAGADALEINISMMPRRKDYGYGEIENRFVRIVDRVRSEIDIPIAVKIGPYFTLLPLLAEKLRQAGASALVLFNRFYQLDIDISGEKLKPGYQFSDPEEIYLPLRWISILYEQTGCDLSGSTGIHDGPGLVKMLLAGAKAVQICSTVYKNSHGRISEMEEFLEDWMTRKGYAAVPEFRGKVSQIESREPEKYERLQYIKALTGLS